MRSGPTWVPYTVHVGPNTVQWDSCTVQGDLCGAHVLFRGAYVGPCTAQVGLTWPHVLFGWDPCGTRVYCSSGAHVEPVYYLFGTYILFSWDPRIKYISLFSIYKK